MEQPDSILEENRWGYIVRSSDYRTFMCEIMFCPPNTWFIDEWEPGNTMKIQKKEEELMAAVKRATKKTPATAAEHYEIKCLEHWNKVDGGNVLRDGCLHWRYGFGEDEEYGIAQKGKWRVAR